MIVVLSLVLSINLIGCKTLQPVPYVEGKDIIFIDKGDKLIKVEGEEQEIKEDGAYFSDTYIEEVVKIKLENK